ncbi:MAG: heme-degrading domain-containing protein [Paenibacillus sp.]|nr:heme-degrading domain-containing protein [Paenibacillus sp.]
MPNNTVLQELLKLEEEIVFSRFTNEMAVEVGLKLYETAREQGKTITIDITRNGHRLFHLAMEGTAADNEQWIRRKNNVVNRFGHSSYYISNMLKESGATFEQVFEVSGADYAAHGGAFPIIIRNVGIVGTVTVSGLPQKEDHDLAVEVLRTFL